MLNTFRDMMLYHSHSTEQTHELKTLLQLFADATSESQDAYNHFFSRELKHFRQLADSFIYQDFIKEENQPLYFYQFIEQVQAHGLTYLGDAFLSTMFPNDFPKTTANVLRRFKGDLIHQEQMMDFLHNRRFRHTCLCHQDIRLNRALLDLLNDWVTRGKITINVKATRKTLTLNEEFKRELLDKILDDALCLMAKAGLLVVET